MASERQHQANRRNGSKGGPSTEAGKQRSRLNTIKHGLTSTTLVVLPEEYQHEYEDVLRGFRESFQPHDAAEDALVLRLAQAHWRSLRSRRVETGILNITAATESARARTIVEDCPERLSPHNAIAVGFMLNPAERWQMYLRYDTTIARDFFRTLDALTRLQRARQLSKPPQKPILAAAAGSHSVETSCQSAVQFVATHDHPPTAEPKTSILPLQNFKDADIHSSALIGVDRRPNIRSESFGLSQDATQAAGPELSDSGIRFVSQNSPALPNRKEQKESTHEMNQENRKPPAHDEHLQALDIRGGKKAAFDFLRNLRIGRNAVSLGRYGDARLPFSGGDSFEPHRKRTGARRHPDLLDFEQVPKSRLKAAI